MHSRSNLIINFFVARISFLSKTTYFAKTGKKNTKMNYNMNSYENVKSNHNLKFFILPLLQLLFPHSFQFEPGWYSGHVTAM